VTLAVGQAVKTVYCDEGKKQQQHKAKHLRTEKHSWFDGCVSLNVFFTVKNVPISLSMFCVKKIKIKNSTQISLFCVFLKSTLMY